MNSVWLCDIANIVVSKGHSMRCRPAYVESEQVLLNITEVTRQQCSISFGWYPTNDFTSPIAGLWLQDSDSKLTIDGAGGWRVETNSMGAPT